MDYLPYLNNALSLGPVLHMHKRPSLAGAGLALLAIINAAQAQSPQHAPYYDGTPQSYCPPAGTVVEFDDGVIMAYHGPLPNRPSICQSRASKNLISQSIFGLVGMLIGQGHIVEGQERMLADAEAFMPALFPLHAGARTRGRVRAPNGAAGVEVRNLTIQVLREESITLPAGTFQAWVIQREDSRPASGAFQRKLFWYDRASGALLREQVIETRGFGNSQPAISYAVHLSLPGEDPYAPAPR